MKLYVWGVSLPEEHWEADNEVDGIEQTSNFVHGTSVHKLIVRKLHMFQKKKQNDLSIKT